MRKFILALALAQLLPAGTCFAATLSNAQLDSVVAGGLFDISCPGCTLASSSSASNNGVTTSSMSTVTLPTAGQTPGGGGSGGNGNGGGGNTGGNTPPPGPSGPTVTTTVAIPSNIATVLSGASTSTIVTP